jgi:hypothetical protein
MPVQRNEQQINAPAAQFGGASNYVNIGTDGALTDAGTQTHSLNAVTVQALTLGTAVTRYLHFSPWDFASNSGASAVTSTIQAPGIGNSASVQVIRFAVTDPSAADVSVQTLIRMPDDVQAAGTMTAKLYTSHTTTGGSAVTWLLSASAYGDLEATAGTVVTATKTDASSSSGSVANVPHAVDMGSFSASGVAAGDLLLLQLILYCTGGSSRRLESDVYGVDIGYKSVTGY